ncbi:MAG: PVC-type heme-binding CxxCH protein, partial [Planctomycetaceae bacterium]
MRELGCGALVAMATLFIAVTALSAAPPTAGTATSGAQAGVVAGQEAAWEAGLATRDLTPQTPIRLSGFGGRREETGEVRQALRASALALSAGDEPPVVLLTLDAMAISYELVEQIASRVQKASGLPPERLAVLCTHSHTAPMLTNVCPTLFSVPIPAEHQRHIDEYTQRLVRLAAEAASEALANRRPARLEWAIGRAGFARNRRTTGGPVDHDLPLLLVRQPDGAIKGVYVSYACHAVTLSDNRVSGDWPGYAREHLERLFPGATALVSVGCGADSNPASGVTGDKADIASEQGLEVAQAALRLSQGPLQPVTPPLVVQARKIALPFDTLPTPEQWQERAQKPGAVGYHARVQLEKLARGEKLPTELPYPVRSFAFGKSLAMLFLPGEVVVDYSLRLKRELDGTRLWTNGYSNGVPCYIPSDRVWKEGGYEGGDAMVYFDRPTRFAPGLEDPLVAAAVEPLREGFAPRVDARRTRGSVPLSPSQSLAALRTAPGLKAELVAAEPLVTSPVAIDFAPDGSVWVAEMYDYPQGLDGQYQPGGRVRRLVSSRDDGRFDKSHIFLEGIPFPTGVTSWRDGVLVCAAPDILYAVDTNHDGRADSVTVLYTGFGTHNYQARVNSLEPGLDGWLYGSCGLFGGTITSHTGQRLELGDRDFRIHPDSGAIEPAVGRTQQGRPRNDAGDWFGCDNSTLIRHYPLSADVRARNPHVLPPPDSGIATVGPDPFTLRPAREVQLFQLSGPSGRATAACGLGIYRDDLLGPGFRGNAFICEPVNLLVHRMVLEPAGSLFAARLPDPEQPAEFVSSVDTWFRPVQARTAPDGSLWIVDMHRFVIEHPRWIPAADVAQLDTRAGHDMGRLFRILPEGGGGRPWPRLASLSSEELVAALDSPNGWQRDMATQLLQWRNARDVIPQLTQLAQSASTPYGRLHALCLLGTWGAAEPAGLRPRFADPDPAVRRHAVRLAAAWTLRDNNLADAVCELAADSDPQVRLQVIDTLADCATERAAQVLAGLAAQPGADPWQRGAVLASLSPRHAPAVLRALLQSAGAPASAVLPSEVLSAVVRTAFASAGPGQVEPLLRALVSEHGAGSPET